MSYLVLARKWRPTTFDEVVGQGHVTRTLKNAINTGRVAHALLFTGSRGVGKTSCARILAKALNCDQGPTVTPCGVCTSCVEITEGRSVDVFEIDGASNNSVEQIREIREAVKFVSSRGKRKLYIIDEVHMLSTAAFNALLKTLEEPPAHVLFVFATTEPHKIPDTIVSRCQRYDFKRISERAIVDALASITEAEGLSVESAALHHIAREAQGGMRDSLSLLDQVIAFSGTRITEAAVRDVLGIADRRILTDLTAAVLAGDGQRALAVVDELFRFGLDLQKFAAEFVQFLRDLMVIKVCAEPDRLVDVPPEELAACARLVADVAPARIHRLFNALMRGAEEVARSPFPKLVFEMTLLRLCEQGPTLPLAEVLSGLARLEGRLDHPVPPEGPRGGGGGGGGGGPRTSMASPARVEAAPPEVSGGPRAEAPATVPSRPGPPPEASVVQPGPVVTGSAALAVAPEEDDLPPGASSYTRKARGLLSDLQWPKPGERSGFDPPVAAVQKVARRTPHLRVVPPVVEEEPAPPAAEPVVQAAPVVPPVVPAAPVVPPVVQAAPVVQAPTPPAAPAVSPADEPDPEAEPLDLADGRPALAHYAHLLRHVEGFTRSQLRNNTYVQRFEPGVLEVALNVVFAGDIDELTAALAAAAARVLDRVPAVRLQACSPDSEALAGETVYEWEQRLATEARRAREEAARRDPAIRAAVSILQAEIWNVRTE